MSATAVKEQYFLDYNKDNIAEDLIQAEKHLRKLKEKGTSSGHANCVLKHCLDASGESDEAVSHSLIVEGPEVSSNFADLSRNIRKFRKKLQKGIISRDEAIKQVRELRRQFESFNPEYDVSKCESCGSLEDFLKQIKVLKPEKEKGKILNSDVNNNYTVVNMPIVERDFLTRLGGSLLYGAIDFAIDYSYPGVQEGLYAHPIAQLPPVDDWVTVGASLAPFLIGHYMKNDMIKKIGEGGLLYSVPRFLHHTLMYATGTWPITPTPAAYAPIRPVTAPAPPLYGERVSPQVPITNHVRYVIAR